MRLVFKYFSQSQTQEVAKMIIAQSGSNGLQGNMAVGSTTLQLIEMAEELGEMILDAAKNGSSFDFVERGAWARLLRLGNAAIGLFLRLQGDGDLGEKIVTDDNIELQRSDSTQSRTLRSIFGEFTFEQFTYSRSTNRKQDLRPIDARLGLSDRRCSYLLEEFSMMFCVESAFGLSAANLETVFGGSFSVDTLESISLNMGEQAQQYLDDLPVPPPDEEGEILVATVDGKGVPLVREDAAKVMAFDSGKTHPGNRRVATLSAVYSIDPYVRTAEDIVAALFRDERDKPKLARPVPQYKHVSAHFARQYFDGDETIISTGPVEACGWLGTEVKRRLQAEQKLLLLIDGDHRLWETAREFLPANVIEILDILHVSKYIWDVAKAIYETEDERKEFARERLTNVLNGGVVSVVRGFRLLIHTRGLTGKSKETVLKTCEYFTKHSDRMRYDECLRAGYPIATGVIEGACRHLVKDRMERSGMRWRMDSAQGNRSRPGRLF
jgi:hypothetical protein